MDGNAIVKRIETDNVYDFIFNINGEPQDFENLTYIYDGDEIEVIVEKKEFNKNALFTLTCFDPNIILNNPESSLDEIDKEKELNY